MAFKPSVATLDLRETEDSLADAGLYVQPNEVHGYAEPLAELLAQARWSLTVGTATLESIAGA